jgi:hypothetical protein
MIQRFLGWWRALYPGAKLGSVAAVALLVFGTWQFVIMPRWDVWRAGLHRAQEKNAEAIRELSEAAGAMKGEREATADVLADYERTQRSLAESAKLAAEFKRQAVTAQAAAAGQDRRIAELEAQLLSAEAKRKAQPKISNIQEAQDALAKIDPRFR